MSKTNDERAHDLWIRTLGNEIQSPLPVSEALDAAESRGFEAGRAEVAKRCEELAFWHSARAVHMVSTTANAVEMAKSAVLLTLAEELRAAHLPATYRAGTVPAPVMEPQSGETWCNKVGGAVLVLVHDTRDGVVRFVEDGTVYDMPVYRFVNNYERTLARDFTEPEPAPEKVDPNRCGYCGHPKNSGSCQRSHP
jgi:hypothetical protein